MGHPHVSLRVLKEVHTRRYYDSQTGRFINEDPARFGAGSNFYPYANNSPAEFIDPFGLEPEQGCKDCQGRPIRGAAAGKRCCGNEPAKVPDEATPYPHTYEYRNISANYMYQFGGDNPWGNRVRSCLLCMYRHGVPAEEAHQFCYANASQQVSKWQVAEGYAAAYFAAWQYIEENNVTHPHGR